MKTSTAWAVGGSVVIGALTSIVLALILSGHVGAALEVLAGLFWLLVILAFLWLMAT